MASGRLNPRDVPPLRPDRRQAGARHGRRRRLIVTVGAVALVLSAAQIVHATPPAATTDVDAKSLTIVNAPPVARITANPTRAQIGQSVTFSGSTSSDPDPGDAIDKYEWDLGTGSFAAGASTAATSFQAGGDKTIRLRVTDKFGATHVATLVLHVNFKPVAKVLFAAANPVPGQLPTVPLIGQQVGFTSRSTDEEATNAEKNNTIAKYEWLDANPPSSGPAGAFGANQPFALHAPYTSAGDKLVVLRVTDNEGAVSDLTATDAIARIRVNTRPVANFTMTPRTPEPGETVTFEEAATDADPDDLTNPSNGLVTKYEWDLDGDGTFGEAGETDRRPSKTYTDAGTTSVTLRVTDGGGARHAKTEPLEVLPRPRAGFSFSPQDPAPGQPVTFTSTSTPHAGETITKVEWDLDGDGTFGEPGETGNQVSHAFSTHGSATVWIRVEDTSGRIDDESATVRVNGQPQASFVAAPGTPLTGDTVTLTSTSDDPDGPLTEAWDIDGDGQFDDATGAVVSRRFTAPGSYTVRLRVTDDRGATAIASGVIKIAQRPAQGVLSGKVSLIDATVQIGGRTTRRGARITLLRVRAPVGARVKLRCKGDDCPVGSKRIRLKRSAVRFKQLQRHLDAGTKIIIEARLEGFIGKRVAFKIRKGKAPKRTDTCIQPGASRPSACPGS